MKKQWTGDQIWIAVMILFVLLLIVAGLAYPKEVKLIPYVVGFPTLFLLLFLWFGGFNSVIRHWVEMDVRGNRRGENRPGESEKGSEFTEWGPVLIIMVWVFLTFLLVFLFGFALISPVFIACFLIQKARMRWPIAVASAVFSTVLIYLFMEGVINADLWCGAIPEIIPGYLGGAIIPPL